MLREKMQELRPKQLSGQAANHFNRKEKVYGQFWTPRLVADFIVSFSARHLGQNRGLACDPACGDGVFLRSLKKMGFEPCGVDIDGSILRMLPDDFKSHVSIEDGLKLEPENRFDLVVGNPPFSSKYGRVRERSLLDSFELGKGRKSQAIEVLFLEKFIRLCRPGGIIGIILPQGIFSNVRLGYVRDYIREHLSVIAIFSLPRNIFRNGRTTSRTVILIGRKEKPSGNRILFVQIQSLKELGEQSFHKSIFAHPDEFLYPEFYLDRNPKLDSLPRLKDFDVEIRQGRTKYGKERRFSLRGIPFISAKVITPLGIDFSKDRRFVEPGGPMDYKNAHVDVDELIFVRVGVGCIGRVAVVTSESEKGIADDWLYILRVKDKRLSPHYLAFWMQTPSIQKEIRRLARGVGTVTIPISLLKELPVMEPEKPELYRKQYLDMVGARKRGNLLLAERIRNRVIREIEARISGL